MTKSMGIHKKHQHLNQQDLIDLHDVMKLRMVKVEGTKYWEYKPGWDSVRVAKSEGGNCTKWNVQRFRNKHYPGVPTEPKTALAPAPVETHTPAPDAAGMFWDRLDTQTDAINQLSASVNVMNNRLTAIGKAVNDLLLVASGIKPAKTDAPPKV